MFIVQAMNSRSLSTVEKKKTSCFAAKNRAWIFLNLSLRLGRFDGYNTLKFTNTQPRNGIKRNEKEEHTHADRTKATEIVKWERKKNENDRAKALFCENNHSFFSYWAEYS